MNKVLFCLLSLGSLSPLVAQEKPASYLTYENVEEGLKYALSAAVICGHFALGYHFDQLEAIAKQHGHQAVSDWAKIFIGIALTAANGTFLGYVAPQRVKQFFADARAYWLDMVSGI